MNGDLYMLEGRTPVREEDVLKWAGWYETADTRVAQTAIGPLEVSTVFIGLDHGRGGGPAEAFRNRRFQGNRDRCRAAALLHLGPGRSATRGGGSRGESEGRMNCAHCEEPLVGLDDVEFAGGHMHRACAFRSVAGSVAHIERRCSCFVPGSDENDPPGMTLRQAARAALAAFTRIQQQHVGIYGRHYRN